MMMRHAKWMLLPMVAIAMTAAVSSCGGDDETVTPQGGGDNPPTPVVEETALTSEEQKQRMQDVGQEFLNRMPASDFNAITELTDYIRDNYLDEDAADELKDWVRSCYDNLTAVTLPEDRSSNTNNSSYYDNWNERTHYNYYTYTYIRKYTRRTYEFSKFKAHIRWNAGKRQWEVAQKNTADLQVTCTDRNGQPVVLTVTASDKTRKVYVSEIKMHSDYEYSYDNSDPYNYRSTSTYTYEYDKAYLEVPEEVNVTLTQGGSTILTTYVKTDLSSMSGTDFDLAKDAFTVEATTSVAGYNFKNIYVTAQANQQDGVRAVVSIEKDGQQLLTANVKGMVTVSGPNTVIGENAEEPSRDILKSYNASETNIDILGKVQVKATCKDLEGYINAIRDADDNRYDESKAKGYVQTANNLVDASLYYDGGTMQQARLELEVFAKQGSSGRTRFVTEPVMVFADGSRYSMVNETYFNETNFKRLIDLYEKLQEDYKTLVRKHFD